jgi:hypothetical protein
MVLILYIYYIYLQNPSFSNKKALQQKAEGLESQGSPYWTGSELFV